MNFIKTSPDRDASKREASLFFAGSFTAPSRFVIFSAIAAGLSGTAEAAEQSGYLGFHDANPATRSSALAINADGTIVVGSYGSGQSGFQAYRWTVSTGGIQGLGTLPGGNYSEARGVSADGSVVVGNSETAADWRAFRWTSGGLQGLGTLEALEALGGLGRRYADARGVAPTVP